MEIFRKKRNRSGGSPTIRVDAKGRFDLSFWGFAKAGLQGTNVQI